MTAIVWFLLGLFTPDPWTLLRAWRRRTWYRFKLRQFARVTATRHMATVARALWTGSTDAYTLVPDLPREENSTEIRW